MVSFNRVSVFALRSAGLKFSLFALALVTLLLSVAASAQQTFTGGAIAVGRTQTAASSGTLTISSPTGSSIATIKIVLNGLTTDGTACADGNCWSLLPTSFYLQSPHSGPKLVLLGGTGDGIDGDDNVDAGSGLNNATITIQDGQAAAPNDVAWAPKTGSFTVKPSSYFLGAGQTPPLGSAADFPQSDGSATLTSRFAGIGIANGDQWTLSIENGEGLTTPINISSWQMIVTYASTTPTSTSISSSQNPAFTTSPNNSVTLTATVSSSGTPTGAVAFTDNGNTISGCDAVALSSGHATCTTTTLAQGYHAIEAAYGGGGGFGQSSGGMTELIEVHPSQSGNTWCNNTSFSTPLNGTGIVYPAVIPVSGYSPGSTVGNVTVELEGVTEPTELLAEFLLVAPGGSNDLDFLDSAFHGAGSSTNLFIADSASTSPNYGSPTNNGIYLPFDGQTQSIDSFPASNSPIVDSGIPAVPGTINYATTFGKTNSLTLQQAFSGAPANGDWALYATASNGSNALTVGGWCVTLDLNSGIGTTTSLSSNAQRAVHGSSVTLTATVKVQGSSTPVTSGTVEFKDETTGAILASANPLDGTGVATVTLSSLAEGSHKILASYSGTGTFNTSFSTMYQRVDDSTGVTSLGGNQWQFCNTGAITIPMGTSGAETPNPSNIFVSNFPGTLKTATLTLTNFSISQGDQLDNTASLVVGPTGTALDFFSNTAGGTIEDTAAAGNYVFADAASTLVPSGSGNLNPGTYKPTSYVGTDSGNDTFTADVGGFYTLPGTFGYSASRGTSTFNSEFGGIAASGTWSLYFSSPNANENGSGAAGGWCLNLTANQPTITVAVPTVDAFTQGGADQKITVSITNTGSTGPTGDPTGGSNPLTVTDTLNSAFTFNSAGSGGSNWNCSAAGQVVTCTNDSAVADNGGTYSPLTIAVNVGAGATGNVTNSVSAIGAGVSSTNSNTETITIDVPPAITSGNSTTFTVGTGGSFTVTTTGTPTAAISETGALPSGVTLTDNGNGTATLAGTPAANSGGSYSFTITANNGTTNANQGFTLTVNQAPAITSSAATTFSVGSAGSFTVTGTGFPAPTFSENGALPSGVTLTTGGVLSGTPAAATGGSYPITITASNGIGTPAAQSFTLTVNQAPAFNLGPTGSDTMAVNTPNVVLIFTTGNPTAAISESGALPSGVTFVDNGNGHGTLSGTPGATTGGLYNLVFTASNGISPNATLNYALTIKQPIVFTSAAATTFTAGSAGLFTVTTTGYPVASFSETGALPSGVTFTDNGNGTASFAGTPAIGTGGIYSITIQATNGSSTPSQSFTLTVDQAPAITSANGTTFVGGSAGSFTVTTTGFPTSALTETGTLPAGVTFTDNGDGTATLAGTPTNGGSFPITITANNGVAPMATQNFTLNVTQYVLSTFGNPAAGGTVSPVSGSTYNPGTIVPIVATPATGYTFVAWTSAADPVASATSASTTITMNGPESVSAQFAPILVVNTSNDDAGSAANCTAQSAPGSNTVDTACSLRDALLNAANSGAANISFDSTVFAAPSTITLSNGTLTVPVYTSITGPTSGSGSALTNLVTVDGGGAGNNAAVFTVIGQSATESIANLIITDGVSNAQNGGGGIVNGYGSGLTVTNSTIKANSASGGPGAIFNDYNATLTLIGSTISNNSGTVGGIVIEAGGMATITNSTITGNTASDTGGAITNAGGTLTITASTISGNSSAGDAGGIRNNGGSFTLANTIVSGNTASTNPDIDGTPTDNGGNQIGAAGISLSPLGSYGGPTQTLVPFPGSPALCTGALASAGSLTADQRGLPFNPACPSGTVDSGAVQTNYAISFTTQPPPDANAGAPMSPAPVVTLTESGVVFTPAVGTVSITDTDNALSNTGTNSEPLSSGTATFSNVIFSSAESFDTLIAFVVLNPNLSPQVAVTSQQSTSFDIAGLATMISPTPGLKTVLPSTNVTFQWAAGAGVNQYRLDLGTSGPGAADVFTYVGTDTTATVSNIHPTGGTVYARLSSYINGKWLFNDYVYTASPVPVKATLTTPTPGLSTLLGASNVNFQWTAGTGVSLYQLSLSVIGPGQSELFMFKGAATSATATTLPAKGQIVYARLYSEIGGVWQSNDYQYTESGTTSAALLTSPAPGLGTVLASTNVTFQWTAGTGVNLYQLNLGSTLGASDLYLYKGTATSTTVPSLPANGQIVYARLYSRINGTWVYDDYQYYNDNGYTEGGTAVAAVLQSPTPGQSTVLGTGNVPFQWSAGTGVTLYQFTLSSVVAGASDLFLYKGSATSANVPSLPSNGALVFARLSSYINGAWQHNDYVYSESGSTVAAVLTSPTPGLATQLGTSNVQFQWTAGTAVTLYQLNLSTVAPGKSELFIYKGSATTTTAPSLPANGLTVYARLYSKINGVWQFNDYVYTEFVEGP